MEIERRLVEIEDRQQREQEHLRHRNIAVARTVALVEADVPWLIAEVRKAQAAHRVVKVEEIAVVMRRRLREHPRMSWQELYPLMARDVADLQLRPRLERDKLIQTIAAWGMQQGVLLLAASLADAIIREADNASSDA